MSRTDPDPVFAAAVQEELERRVRSVRRPASASSPRRRPWLMEVGAVAGVAAVAVGVALGFSALRPLPDTGGVPAGSVTTSSAPDATATPSSTPHPATTTPPTAPPASTAPPTAPPTASTPTTPTAPAADPTTPPPTSPSGLVGPSAARQRSSGEIRSWALSLGFGEIWAEQAVLDTSCMAEHGFLYDPVLAQRSGDQRTGMTPAQITAYREALWGPTTDAPYDWRTAGCHGRSVHVTGQDDNH